MFQKIQKVYFGHIDRAGIVYHPHFIDYFNQAYEDFVEELGFDDKNLNEQLGVSVPVVNVDVDFENPVQSGDRLEITVLVKRLGISSMCFRFEAVEQASGKMIAKGDVTRVTVGPDFRPIEIPAAFREALEPHVDTDED